METDQVIDKLEAQNFNEVASLLGEDPSGFSDDTDDFQDDDPIVDPANNGKGTKQDAQTTEMSDDRVNELTKKAKQGTLSDEEIAELKSAGFDVQIQGKEEKPEEKTITKERLEELTAKAETGELTDEEVAELTSAGYEVNFEGEESKPKGEEEKPKVEFPGYKESVEALTGQQFESVEDFNNAVEQIVNKYQEMTDGLNGIIDANPALEKLLAEMMNGTELETAVAKHLGIEGLAPEPGDDGYKEWVEMQAEKKLAQKQEKKAREERMERLKNSQQEMVKYIKENKVSQDRAQKLFSTIDDFVDSYNKGDLMKYVPVIMKGLFADEEKETAVRKAVIQEKNRIHLTKRSKSPRPIIVSRDSSEEEEFIDSPAMRSAKALL